MFNFDENDYFGKKDDAVTGESNSAEETIDNQMQSEDKDTESETTGFTSQGAENNENPPSAESSDSTYHYGPSMQNNDSNATRYPYGHPTSTAQGGSYSNPHHQYAPNNAVNNNQPPEYGRAAYNQQPPRQQYPYGQSNGAAGNPYSGYSNQPPMPPRNNNQPFYNKPTNNGGSNKGGKIVFGIMAAVICVLLVAVIVILAGNGGDVEPSTTAGTNTEITQAERTTSDSVIVADTQPTPGDGSQVVADSDSLTPSEIYNKVHKSSVGLLVYDPRTSSLAGEGSGVAYGYDENNEYTYFITCAHVISDAGANIVVQTSDETKYDAEIVGYDTRTDIGVIRVKSTDFELAAFGDSSALSVGSAVYAIGNPGGTEFAGSFTDGIVSAIDRPVQSNTGYDIDCIQHTAAINPGNSGGALVNAYGQVIGINSMKIVDDEYEGMGFAVPVSVALPVVKDIVTYGYVANRPKLGVSFYEASSYNYFYYYFVMSNGFGEGSIIVAEISSDGALADTQVKVGDVITEVNGEKLDNSDTLSDLVADSAVGDEITLTIVRPTDQRNVNQYDTFKVTVTLVEDTGTTPEVEQEEESTVFDPFAYYWNYGN